MLASGIYTAQAVLFSTPALYTRVRVGIHMQNVRANVKVMEFESPCIFSCILTLLIILIEPFTTKAHPVTVAPLVIYSNQMPWQ